jgi:hypothetical protein
VRGNKRIPKVARYILSEGSEEYLGNLWFPKKDVQFSHQRNYSMINCGSTSLTSSSQSVDMTANHRELWKAIHLVLIGVVHARGSHNGRAWTSVSAKPFQNLSLLVLWHTFAWDVGHPLV